MIKRKVMSVLLVLFLLMNYSTPIAALAISTKNEAPTVQTLNGASTENQTNTEVVEEDIQEDSTEELAPEVSEGSEESEAELPLDDSELVTEEGTSEETTEEPAQDEEALAALAIEAGEYTISSAKNSSALLSIADKSEVESAQLELRSEDYNNSEQFELISLEDGWFAIKNVNSGLFVEVKDSSELEGAAVQQRQENNTDAQKWRFVDAGNGYVYVQSKLGTVLDCSDTGLGNTIQVKELNHEETQKWRLNKSKNLRSSVKLIEIPLGEYQIASSGTDKLLSTKTLTKDNVPVSLQSNFYNKSSHFRLEKTGDGWYYIVNVYSNKVLDIKGGKTGNGIALQQYSKNGTNAQKFRFVDAGDGYVYIESKLGKVLERTGTNVQTYTLNKTAAQKWKFEAPKGPKTISIQNGARYFLSSNVNLNKVLDVSKGSTSNKANIQLWTEDAVKQQKFIIQSSGDGWYKLVNEKSGKVLDVSGGKVASGTNVQQYTWNNTDAQKFRFIDAGSGLCYIQNKLGYYLDVSGGKNANGANIQTYQLNYTNAQKFRLEALGKDFIRTTILSSSSARVTIFSSSVSASSMKFPTWSRNKGQDDIKWLDGKKNYDGSWSAVVNSSGFKDAGTYDTHIYANGKTYLGATSYSLKKVDDAASRLAKPPYYYSQLDSRWSGKTYGKAKLGPTGCVPTSLAMVLKGSYGVNVTPVDTANRIYSYGGFNQKYYGSSATDLFKATKSYGRSISSISSLSQLNKELSQGYPVIMFLDVGIGHAVVAHGYSNGKTYIYDPYGKQYYNGWVSTSSLWKTPSKDPIDLLEGRPYFVIK